MKAKRLAAMLLAAVTAMSLVACGGSANQGGNNTPTGGTEAGGNQGENQGENQGGSAAEERGLLAPNQETGNTTKSDETLVINMGSFPSNLVHFLAKGGSGENQEQIVGSTLFDRLVDLDENTGEVIPMLATEWNWTDGTHLQFKLREGVKFVDGHTLNADDVVYSVNTWIENCGVDENGEGGNDTGKYFKGVTKDDDMTVTIETFQEAPGLVKMLSWSNFDIISEAEVNALGGPDAARMAPRMGTGKYIFKEWKDGEYITVERNEDYWDPSYVGYFKEIKFVAINDPGAAAAAVQSGDVHVSWQMPVAQAASFVKDEKVRTYAYTNGEVEHLWFNMREDHPTSDIRVRQAIAKLLNYDAIAAVGTAGLGTKCYSYMPLSASFYSADYTEEDFAIDIEGAKALLADAGYPDGLTISVPTLPDQVDMYQVMQNNLAAGGITLEINQVDMGGFVPAMLFEKSYDITAVGDGVALRTPNLTQFVSGGMSFGGPAVKLEKDEEVLNRLMVAKTDDEAKAVLQEFNALVKEELPCVNLFEAYGAALVNSSIKGYSVRERAYVDATTCFK